VERIRSLEVTPPLRILGMIASPCDLAPLDVAREKARVEQAVASLCALGPVEVTLLEGHRRDLQREKQGGPWQHGSVEVRRRCLARGMRSREIRDGRGSTPSAQRRSRGEAPGAAVCLWDDRLETGRLKIEGRIAGDDVREWNV